MEREVHKDYSEIKIINSKDYATTNNMYSAYLGKSEVGGHEFLIMNADVFFDSSVISSLLAFKEKNAIVTEIGTYIEESMKVVEKDGKLIKISKQIDSNEALGSSIDVYKFSVEGGNAFF